MQTFDAWWEREVMSKYTGNNPAIDVGVNLMDAVKTIAREAWNAAYQQGQLNPELFAAKKLVREAKDSASRAGQIDYGW